MSIALVLGGGAPNLTLMSGALAALDEKGVEFEIVSTLGAGMLVGLLYATSQPGEERKKALLRTIDLGIADAVHDFCPVNFKVFHRPGAAAEWYRSLMRCFQLNLGGPAGDWTQLMLSAFCPTDLTPWSLGLCQPAPWIEDAVDFSKLGRFKGDFFLSAYCLEDRRMRMFKKEEINAGAFRAGLAMPLIYPPYRHEGKTYIEGSAYDTFNFEDLFVTHEKRPDLLVVFDVLGRKEMLRSPKHLLDAWVMSIMTPLVSMARDDLKLFCLQHARTYRKTTRLLRVKYKIPKGYWPKVLDWSRENLETLYAIGYQAGLDFHRDYAEELEKKRWFKGGVYPSCSEILKARIPPRGLQPVSEAAVRSVPKSHGAGRSPRLSRI